MSKIFGFSAPTYFRWKKENRPIITLLEKYFSKEDLLDYLNNETISSYEVYRSINTQLNSELNYFCSPDAQEVFIYTSSKKFLWDFLFRFKKELSEIQNHQAKKDITILLYEYQIILLNIAKTIDYSKSKIAQDIYNFINCFNEKDEKFILYFINSVKYNYIFKYYFDSKESFNSQYMDIPVYDKNLIKIDIEVVKHLNTLLSQYEILSGFSPKLSNDVKDFSDTKDFFEVYEDYLQ